MVSVRVFVAEPARASLSSEFDTVFLRGAAAVFVALPRARFALRAFSPVACAPMGTDDSSFGVSVSPSVPSPLFLEPIPPPCWHVPTTSPGERYRRNQLQA